MLERQIRPSQSNKQNIKKSWFRLRRAYICPQLIKLVTRKTTQWVSVVYSTTLSQYKLKLSYNTPGRHLGERYSSYSFSTSALDVGEWSTSRPGRALAPGKRSPVPIGQEAGWDPEPVWTQRLEGKSFASAGDRTSIARSSSP
jgi:hypothetical protein